MSEGELGMLIDKYLQQADANGDNRTIFSMKVAEGIVMSIRNKPFATIDVGLVPGAGTGTGVGIVGLSEDHMTETALALFPSQGKNARPLVMAIMKATKEHLMAKALLTSNHAPVYTGVGTVQVGSIGVSKDEMSENIDEKLKSADANGENRKKFCDAIAAGVALELIGFGTGVVAITPTPPTPPTPVPGAGSGTGVIT